MLFPARKSPQRPIKSRPKWLKFREVSPKVGCSSLRASASSQHLPTLTFSKTATPANVLAYVMREGFGLPVSHVCDNATECPPPFFPPASTKRRLKKRLRNFLNSPDLYVGPSFRTLRLSFHPFFSFNVAGLVSARLPSSRERLLKRTEQRLLPHNGSSRCHKVTELL